MKSEKTKIAMILSDITNKIVHFDDYTFQTKQMEEERTRHHGAEHGTGLHCARDAPGLLHWKMTIFGFIFFFDYLNFIFIVHIRYFLG